MVTEMRVMGEVEDEEPLESGGEDEMPEEIDEELKMKRRKLTGCRKMETVDKKMDELLEEDVQNLRSFTFENAAREARRVPLGGSFRSNEYC